MRYFNAILLFVVLASACGQADVPPNVRRTTDRILEAETAETRARLLRHTPGRVIDSLEWWEDDGRRVFTILSENIDTSADYRGIFLRHYYIGVGGTELLWTYEDSLNCSDRLALTDLDYDLGPLTSDDFERKEKIPLAYTLICEDQPIMADFLIDTRTGLPLPI